MERARRSRRRCLQERRRWPVRFQLVLGVASGTSSVWGAESWSLRPKNRKKSATTLDISEFEFARNKVEERKRLVSVSDSNAVREWQPV